MQAIEGVLMCFGLRGSHPQTAIFTALKANSQQSLCLNIIYQHTAYFNLIRYIYIFIYIYMIWIHLYPKDFGTQIHGQLLVSV